MQRQVHSVEEMYQSAKELVESWGPRSGAVVIGLSGDLGSGKTTFVQGVARALGVAEHVTSPTFVIQKNYQLEGQPFAQLVHIDAYRLEGAHELSVLGFQELIVDPGNIILIEWPEKVAEIIPQDAVRIECRFIDETTREVIW